MGNSNIKPSDYQERKKIKKNKEISKFNAQRYPQKRYYLHSPVIYRINDSAIHEALYQTNPMFTKPNLLRSSSGHFGVDSGIPPKPHIFSSPSTELRYPICFTPNMARTIPIRRSMSCPKTILTYRRSNTPPVGICSNSPLIYQRPALSESDPLNRSLSSSLTSFRIQGSLMPGELYISPRVGHVISTSRPFSEFQYREDINTSLSYSHNQSEHNISLDERVQSNVAASPVKPKYTDSVRKITEEDSAPMTPNKANNLAFEKKTENSILRESRVLQENIQSKIKLVEEVLQNSKKRTNNSSDIKRRIDETLAKNQKIKSPNDTEETERSQFQNDRMKDIEEKITALREKNIKMEEERKFLEERKKEEDRKLAETSLHLENSKETGSSLTKKIENGIFKTTLERIKADVYEDLKKSKGENTPAEENSMKNSNLRDTTIATTASNKKSNAHMESPLSVDFEKMREKKVESKLKVVSENYLHNISQKERENEKTSLKNFRSYSDFKTAKKINKSLELSQLRNRAKNERSRSPLEAKTQDPYSKERKNTPEEVSTTPETGRNTFDSDRKRLILAEQLAAQEAFSEPRLIDYPQVKIEKVEYIPNPKRRNSGNYKSMDVNTSGTKQESDFGSTSKEKIKIRETCRKNEKYRVEPLHSKRNYSNEADRSSEWERYQYERDENSERRFCEGEIENYILKKNHQVKKNAYDKKIPLEDIYNNRHCQFRNEFHYKKYHPEIDRNCAKAHSRGGGELDSKRMTSSPKEMTPEKYLSDQKNNHLTAGRLPSNDKFDSTIPKGSKISQKPSYKLMKQNLIESLFRKYEGRQRDLEFYKIMYMLDEDKIKLSDLSQLLDQFQKDSNITEIENADPVTRKLFISKEEFDQEDLAYPEDDAAVKGKSRYQDILERKMGRARQKEKGCKKGPDTSNSNKKLNEITANKAVPRTDNNLYMEHPTYEEPSLGPTLDKLAIENMMDDILKRKRADFKYEVLWNKDVLPKEAILSKHLLLPYQAIKASSPTSQSAQKCKNAASVILSSKKGQEECGPQKICRKKASEQRERADHSSSTKKQMKNTYLDEKGIYSVIINRRKSWNKDKN